MKKKALLALLLACTMGVGMVSASAAADATEAPKTDPTAKTITVDSADDLTWLSTYSNSDADVNGIPRSFSGWTIQITKDIDMKGASWTPIKGFAGTMTGVPGEEGGSVTISGLKVNVTGDGAGLCGSTPGGARFANIKITNSTFEASGYYAGAFLGNGFVSQYDNCHAENVTVTANRFVGGLTGTTYGNITDCTVTGSKTNISVRGTSIISRTSGDNVGGLVGLLGENATKISGCLVDGVTVTGARQVGGIAGALQYGNFLENCTVKNSTINSVGTGILVIKGASPCAGGLVGQFASASDTETIHVRNNIVQNVTVTQKYSKKIFTGWAIGDVNSRLNAAQYEISGNRYIGTTTLNEVGFDPANPSAPSA